MKPGDSEQLHWWLLGFGDFVVAIAPLPLHADMQRALAIATMHYTDQWSGPSLE